MEADRTIERLLVTPYRLHGDSAQVQRHGLYVADLIDASGIDLANGVDAGVAAAERMRARGWVRTLSKLVGGRLWHFTRIQLTEEGSDHAKLILSPRHRRYGRDLFVAIVEGVTRALDKR